MSNANFYPSEKKSISEFNSYELRGWILERMCNIELRINDVIIDYFEPKREKEFEEIILDSTVTNLGGKLKILRNIEGFDNRQIENIRELSVIRNYFAHSIFAMKIMLTISDDGSPGSVEMNPDVHYMNSSGALKTKPVRTLINEFYNLHEEIRNYFQEYLRLLSQKKNSKNDSPK